MEFGDIAQIFIVLILLLGVMYSLLYLVRKYLFTFDKKGSKLVKIKVLSTQILMPKKYVSVVKIRDKVFVLGISDNSITLLDKQDDFTQDIDQETESTGGTKNFFEILKQNMSKK